MVTVRQATSMRQYYCAPTERTEWLCQLKDGTFSLAVEGGKHMRPISEEEAFQWAKKEGLTPLVKVDGDG